MIKHFSVKGIRAASLKQKDKWAFTVTGICNLSVHSRKSRTNFIKIALWHGCSPVNLLHTFKTPFLKNTSEGLRL